MNNRSSQDFNRRLNRTDKPFFQLAQESHPRDTPVPDTQANRPPESEGWHCTTAETAQPHRAPPEAAGQPAPTSVCALPPGAAHTRDQIKQLNQLVKKQQERVRQLHVDIDNGKRLLDDRQQQLAVLKDQLEDNQNQVAQLKDLASQQPPPQPPAIAAANAQLGRLKERHRDAITTQARCRPLPPDFEPSHACYEYLQNFHGVPPDYACAQLAEFKFYWHDTGEARKGWDSQFSKHVLHNWRRQQNEKQTTRTQTRHPTHEELTDRSWIGKYDFDPDGDLDP
ncbi:MAG: DnaT-like ssDNA-binding domain-containing protein [Kistimonas sp.]|nr:DnaT-like ssDNA-binding domain-containing protein [Kistimonas sp.]